MVIKRFTLVTPFGTLEFDVSLDCELAAAYLKWMLSTDIFNYPDAYKGSLYPKPVYVVREDWTSTLVTSGSSVSLAKMLGQDASREIRVSMTNAVGPCPASTFSPPVSVKYRSDRIYWARITGTLFHIGQRDTFKMLFTACLDVIDSTIADPEKKYQAMAEFAFTALSPPHVSSYRGIPDISVNLIEPPHAHVIINQFHEFAYDRLSKIRSKNSYDWTELSSLKDSLIWEWRQYRTDQPTLSLSHAENVIFSRLVDADWNFSQYVKFGSHCLVQLLSLYPAAIDLLEQFGIADIFVLWQERFVGGYLGFLHHFHHKLLPEKPFLKLLPPVAYSRIFDKVQSEPYLLPPEAPTDDYDKLILFTRLYNILSGTGGRIDRSGSKLLYKAINNNLVLKTLTGPLGRSLDRRSITKLLNQQPGSYGISI